MKILGKTTRWALSNFFGSDSHELTLVVDFERAQTILRVSAKDPVLHICLDQPRQNRHSLNDVKLAQLVRAHDC